MHFWRVLEIFSTWFFDRGGGSTIAYVCKNYRTGTLKGVNITVCKLDVYFFFFNGEKTQQQRLKEIK